MTLKVWLKSVFKYNFNFVAYLGYRNITFFTSAVFEVSSASAKHPSCCVWVFEPLIQTYINWTCWNTFTYYFISKFEFRDLQRSRSTGEDLDIVLCGYVTMKMNSDDKLNVVISYKLAHYCAVMISKAWSVLISRPGLPRLLPRCWATRLE